MGSENTPVLETSTVTISGAVKRGIETEVLGPLRIWHIIGISFTILTSAVFMLCCCCNFRVPRTRQQIEENYLKRKINKRYLHLLERNPEKLTAKRGRWLRIKDIYKSKVSATDSSGKINILNSPSAFNSQCGNAGVMMQSGDVNASEDAHLAQKTEQIILNTLFHRLREPVGVQIPSHFRPRDILAMVAQQPRLVARQPTLNEQRFRLTQQPNLVLQQARLSSQQSIMMNAQQPRLSAGQPTLGAQQNRFSSQQQTLMNVQQPRLSARQSTLGAHQSRFNAQQKTLMKEQQPRLNVLTPKLTAHQPRLNAQQKTLMNVQQPRMRAQQPRLIAPALNAMQPRVYSSRH